MEDLRRVPNKEETIKKSILFICIISVMSAMFSYRESGKIHDCEHIEYRLIEEQKEPKVETIILNNNSTFVKKQPQIEEKEEIVSYSEIIDNIHIDMDISKTSGISEEDFVFAISNSPYDRNEILEENASLIWNECQERQINEFVICGIIARESLWCDSELAINRKNVMSIKNNEGEYKIYSDYSDCIKDGIRLLSEEYISEKGRYSTGGNISEIGSVYAEHPEWADLVIECAIMCTRSLPDEEKFEI